MMRLGIVRLLVYAFFLWLVARDLASDPTRDDDDDEDDEDDNG